MKIHLYNNELILSEFKDKALFNGILFRDLHNVKFREYKGKYYFSMADFHQIRKAISAPLRNEIKITPAYRSFAEQFVLCKENDITIEWGPVTSTIYGKNIPLKFLVPATSYFDKKAVHAKSYGKTWSGFSHLLDLKTGEFPSGLIEIVINVLAKHGIPYEIKRTFSYPEPYLHLKPEFSFTPTQDQIDAVTALNAHNNGIAKLPTGFGKTSFVAASLIANKGVKAIFLANQRVLVDDAKADFKDVFKNDDIKIGTISDGVFDPGDITVASIQSIASALEPPTSKELNNVMYQYELARGRFEMMEGDDKKKANREMNKLKKRIDAIQERRQRHEDLIPFLNNEVDLFIVDESQVLGTGQWNKFLHACKAPYRYTMSATDTRSDGGRLQIVAATGERRFESSASEQIQKRRLSEFMGHFTKFDHKMPQNLIKDVKMAYHQAYEVFIVHNEIRNRFLCDKVMEWAKDFSVLALVTRREHGEIVVDMLQALGMKEGDARYIDGETPKKLRRDTIEAYRNGEFPVLIGTSIFDVGFNAKNAAKMVRFNAGGSEVREPQRAGRTVRLRDDDSIGESFDVIDINCPFFEAQGWKRYRFLRDEFGKDRVRVHKETIEGELNIVGLQEIVDDIPDQTDQKTGQRIIDMLASGEDEFDEDATLFDYDFDDSLKNKLRDLTEE